MTSTQVTIAVTSVDAQADKMIDESPMGKLAIVKRSSRSSSRHSWVHGSPRSCRAGNSSSKAKTTKSEASYQFLTLPQPVQQDPYTTPKHKEACLADVSNTERSERMLKALQAPKKRDEMFDEISESSRSRAHDYENMSIRAFRLDSSSSKGDGSSTAGDSSCGHQQQAALEEMRSQWQAFSANIMNVKISPQDQFETSPMAFSSLRI